MTYGKDVAYGISRLSGNLNAYKETVQIATPEFAYWKDILKFYLDVIEDETGKRPSVFSYEAIEEIDGFFEGGYQTCYDRQFHRAFNSCKADSLCGKINYAPLETTLKQCLGNFIHKKKPFDEISWEYEALLDTLTGERAALHELAVDKNATCYQAAKYPIYGKTEKPLLTHIDI